MLTILYHCAIYLAHRHNFSTKDKQMQFNRSEIMTAAWKIARRFEGNGEPRNKLMSRALKAAWFNAKSAAAVQRNVATATAQREALSQRPANVLQAEITNLENKTRLNGAGQDRLSALRAAQQLAA